MGLFAGVSVISIIEASFQIFSTAVTRVMKFINRNKVHVINSTSMLPPKNVSFNREHVLYQCSKFFYKYIIRSDLHGLHYITDKNKKLAERIFWALAVLISTVFCLFSIFDVTRHSELNPIEFAIDDKLWSLTDVRKCFRSHEIFSENSFQIPFPAVIVCVGMNMEKYREFENCVYHDKCEDLPQKVQERFNT